MSVICSLALTTRDKMRELLAAPDRITDFLHREDEDIYADPHFHCVEGNWTGMHYLLNGCSTDAGEPPLDFFIAGGSEVGDVDLGYGPARIFAPVELVELVTALSSISDAMLRSRFDANAMDLAGVPGWEPNDRDTLVEQTRELITFLANGPQRGLALIVWFD